MKSLTSSSVPSANSKHGGKTGVKVRTSIFGAPLPNKPLKLTAAGFGGAGAVLNTQSDSITRGRSLAAIR